MTTVDSAGHPVLGHPRGDPVGYPFSAVVGMDDMRLALVLNAVSPTVGGVLVRGEKGTAKSTTVRALASVLPPVEVVTGCRFSCDPAAPDPHCPDGAHGLGSGDGPDTSGGTRRPARLVELPIGATEDRLVGALDLERALTEGVRAFEPGLLAAAHRGVLYVDEVNLLPDHLVDALLDAAALGVCHVERDGVSVRHAARFLLVGTMNPEEGELRPQLLDRFGLTVDASAPREPAARAEVVRRRLAFEADPAAFAAGWAEPEAGLAERIRRARRLLPAVVLPDPVLGQIAEVCAAFEVDGLRADLVIARAAVAHAAWTGLREVTEVDVRAVARLALPHRARRNPFDTPGLDEERLERALSEAKARSPRPDPDGPDGPDGPDPDGSGPDGSGPDGSGPDGSGPDGSGPGGSGPGGPAPDPGSGVPRAGDTAGGGPAGERTAGEEAAHGRAGEERSEDGGPANGRDAGHGGAPATARTAAPTAPFRARLLELPGVGKGVAGRRSRAHTAHGRVTRARRPRGPLGAAHLPATVLAAAPHQRARGRRGPGLVLRREDLREAHREGREGNLVLFVVDASGSMAARARMAAVKGAVLSLLLDAYQRRDKVGLVTFAGEAAEVVLPPTPSAEAAVGRLRALATGGRTPLAAGLLRAGEVLRIERLRDPQRRPLLVLVTDGRATGPAGTDPIGDARRAARLLAAAGTPVVVVDCESGPVRLGLAGEVAAALGAVRLRPDELRGDTLAGSVRAVRDVKGVA